MRMAESLQLSSVLVEALKFVGYIFSGPVSDEALSRLAAAAGVLPEGIVQYLTTSDGLRHPTLDRIFGSEDMLKPYPSNSLLPLKSDGCGNYDAVFIQEGFLFGAVVFWDHETSRAEYLIASSVPVYLSLLVTCPPVERWDVNGASQNDFLRAHDPGAIALLDDPSFGRFVGPIGMLYGREREPADAEPVREGINPLTKERVVFTSLSRQRRPPGSVK